MEILNPSCSEMVFRLKGSLKDIRTEVLKMLDIILKGDGLNKSILKKIEKSKEKINNVKNLEEFNLINFDFSWDYDTYFKKEGADLLVATTRNEDWDELNIDIIDEDEESYSYWDVAGLKTYKELFCDERYLIAINDNEDDENEKKEIVVLEREDKGKIEIKYEYEKEFKLARRENCFYLPKNKFIKLIEVKDKKKRNKLKILANL